mmetsp:Transcript_19765/g.42926  ORF Transcript_19765/g.42926 Transcript_19765/m.42926 type:complete len:478 (+) Transcript_19765:258-1691(+)|eukprot:CAMPEP_0168191600 /NCGR_PEP_ID=MMETSP0139_2-20121125/17607_1 /TAXON_ID=44445 /ORGANISM="Pseudo-nitzschia australis, Strain 10249 10 AB" /LENGTH=477 /DNA_ID=CAMNT_0008114795 /DNA_START=184 /DNA_END=1617 /DNA_ORIENTATION=-
MPSTNDYNDDRHKKEEMDRREKRKSAKSQKSDAQREKERKRKEHIEKTLRKHGGERKKQKTEPEATSSAFQALFKQRAQGFEIAFKFRNAPPRPPVGPCFIGTNLDEKLREISQYKPLNAVEVNYRWKLHNEPDLGVPLAPSAMDPMSYKQSKIEETQMHPGDLKLLEWDGSMEDTAAEELKQRRDNARAAARLALMGKLPAKFLMEKTKTTSSGPASTKKAFSRVLNENMQSWMKKTTYITNDYGRKVHDFKSLAKTKQELEQELEVRQQKIMQRRSAPAVSKTFEEVKATVRKHPSKKGVTAVAEMSFLPNIKRWGNAYTHVVVDKTPGDDSAFLNSAFVANVQKKDATARMTCELFGQSENDSGSYLAMQNYELDVVPLKEGDAPHANFCIWVDPENNKALYTPISSRVQLSNGRPIRRKNYKMNVTRRPMNDEDMTEINERLAEVDTDINSSGANAKSGSNYTNDGSDDSDGD